MQAVFVNGWNEALNEEKKNAQKNGNKTEHHIIIKYTYYVVTLVKKWANRNEENDLRQSQAPPSPNANAIIAQNGISEHGKSRWIWADPLRLNGVTH